MAETTRWLIVAYGLAGLVVFARLARNVRSVRVCNGNRVRWPALAALAWGHLVIASVWTFSFLMGDQLGLYVRRAALIAIMCPISFLSLRLNGRYWRR